MQILIIDDNAQNLEIMKKYLTLKNFEVLCTLNTRDGLNILKLYHIDLIIIEVALSNDSSLDFLKHIEQDIHSSTIPIILISSCLSIIERNIIPKKNNYQFIVKPIRFSSLLSAIEHTNNDVSSLHKISKSANVYMH